MILVADTGLNEICKYFNISIRLISQSIWEHQTMFYSINLILSKSWRKRKNRYLNKLVQVCFFSSWVERWSSVVITKRAHRHQT